MADGKYTVYEEGGQVRGHIKTFVIDEVEDIQDLPDDTPIGSSALVIATSDVYMLNNEREWKPL